MGYSRYSVDDRSIRSASLGYNTKDVNDIFIQNKTKLIHELMEPSNALIRESRDSVEHPLSVPIIIGLDHTGSMGHIPVYLIREGLPKMVSNIIEHGIPDPQILFLGIGDSRCDSAPLQVGQFESGDEELDMWLTRTYLEGHGGGNGGESYLLAWYFAAKHTVTDAWEKRNERGFLFTIGDEPCHRTLHGDEISKIMGINDNISYTDQELLSMANEKYDVYHLHMEEGLQGRSAQYWENLLGDHLIMVKDKTKIDNIIAEIVTKNRSQEIDLSNVIVK